ncbi:MAG: polyprenol monophosphomannose synthase [Bacteroidales bacterium]
MSTEESKCVVIIPTYNEIDNISNIIDVVMSLSRKYDILVVDDASPDGTADIVRTKQQRYTDRIFLLSREGKLGLGTAYIAGFKWALKRNYEYIFEMDADFSHNPTDLIKLHDACLNEGADVAIGSRYISGVNVVNWPIGRVVMSYFASKYVRFITGMKIADTTAGFKCFRRKVLETINLKEIKFKGYAFQIEMKFKAYKCGFKLVEIPIIFINRTQGISKMSGGIFGEAFLGVIKLKIDSFLKKPPYKK